MPSTVQLLAKPTTTGQTWEKPLLAHQQEVALVNSIPSNQQAVSISYNLVPSLLMPLFIRYAQLQLRAR